jgi:hypothetical protein
MEIGVPRPARHRYNRQGKNSALLRREEIVPKLVTVHRHEEVMRQAHDYVKSYILFPSGLLGLVSMVGGVGALGYQLMASDSYTWGTFYQSSALILLGVVMGVWQTTYHQYLLRRFPDVFAARMRAASSRKGRKAAGDTGTVTFDHAGRRLIPFAYVAGGALLIGSAAWAAMAGEVIGVAAVLLPWAGFYWARLFFWRRVVA